MKGQGPVPANPRPAGVEVDFKALFIIDANQIGVRSNKDTGSVGIDFGSPPTLNNLVIGVTVTDLTVTQPKHFHSRVRVQIHDSIKDLWLTPSPLTIPRKPSGIRFSLLARFNDDVIGVIPHEPRVRWTSNKKGLIDVEELTGKINPGATETSADITATVELGSSFRSTTATVNVDDSWSDAVQATSIPTKNGKFADITSINEKKNILFIPDGFTNEREFDEIVRKIVDAFRTNPKLKPFNILSGSINYFSAFKRSREEGISILYNNNIKSFKGELKGTTSQRDKELDKLIDIVGLPIPADKDIALGTKLPQWQNIYENILSVNESIYKKWQDLSARGIVNEKDTWLGMCFGAWPSLSTYLQKAPRIPGFHPFRINRENLDEFLSKITYMGNLIGTHWTTGKDRALVFVLLGGSRKGGNVQRDVDVPWRNIAAASVGNQKDIKIRKVSDRLHIVPYKNPENPDPMILASVGHETGHILGGLGDEYGEDVHLPDDKIGELEKELNIQDEKSLSDPSGINADKIKWLWHRIKKAGVVNNITIIVANKSYKISLKSNAKFFERNENAFLRTRPLKSSLKPSNKLIIERVDIANDEVDVSVSPDQDLFSLFGGDSIIFVPVKNPLPSGPRELMLVAPNILEHINNTHAPLNTDFPPPSGNPRRACCELVKDVKPRQYAKNLPSNLRKKLRSSSIVGLYEGGHRYYCGVYHPTGQCMMRGKYESEDKVEIFPFCHVCQYILVDSIDPTKHGLLDAQYRNPF